MAGRQKSDEKREEILAAAEREFARRDFHEVLMDDVAARAGVGKGTLYRYFPTKEELFLATVLRGLDGSHAEFLRVFAQDAPLEQILETAVARMLSYFSGRAPLLTLLQRYEGRLSPADANAWRQRRVDALAAIVAVLERAERVGGIRKLDTELAADMLLGMVRTAVQYPRKGMSQERMAREIVALFLNGVRQVAAPARAHRLRAVRGARA
ncbi:MAG: TetR/AcrR family transcriptional regulator [Thermodesulfobacteriota bacterium]